MRVVEHSFQKPNAAFEWIGIHTGGIHGEDGRSGEKAAAVDSGINGDFPKFLPGHTRDSVVLCQGFVDDEVVRLEEIHNAAIVAQDVVEEGMRLRDEVLLERFVVNGELQWIDDEVVQGLKAQPLLDKVLGESL